MNANAYDRIWPDELAVHKSNPAAIPMLADGRDAGCLNCGGSGVMVYGRARPTARPVR